jgi:hypothetical protein
MNENGKTKALIFIVVLIMAGTIVGAVISHSIYERGKELAEKRGLPFKDTWERRIFTISFMAGIVFNSINIFLLIGLLWVYGNTYAHTKSNFMLGLIFFIGVLLIQSIFSLPILHVFFGYSTYGLGPFGFLPNLFETFALIILLLLSME